MILSGKTKTKISDVSKNFGDDTVFKSATLYGNSRTVVQRWYPLLCVLRFFGLMPLSFSTVSFSESEIPKLGRGKYPNKKIICSFKIFSPAFFLTAFVFGGVRVFYILTLADVPELRVFKMSIFGNSTMEKVSLSSSFSVYKLVEFFYGIFTPFVNLAEWIAVMIAMPKVVLFFNGWENFEIQYIQHFDQSPSFNPFAFYMASSIFCTCLPLLNAVFMAEFLSESLAQSLPRKIGSAFNHILLSVILLLEDTKTVCLFYMSADAFTQVHNGIKRKSSKLNFSEVEARTIRCWLEILRTARTQAYLAGKCTSLYQTVMTGYLSTIYTMFVFMAIETTSDKEFSHFSWFYIWLVVGGLIRTYIKTYFADKIIEEEAKIVDLLAYLDISDANYDVKYEVKNIMDLLIHSPSRITYYGLITFDRSIILSVVGSVVTYLIILLQMKGGENSKC